MTGKIRESRFTCSYRFQVQIVVVLFLVPSRGVHHGKSFCLHSCNDCTCSYNPGEKEHVSAQYIIVNTWILCEFLRVLPHITAPNHPFPMRSKTEVTERFDSVCVRTFGYKVPEYRPLQANFNVEMLVSLILTCLYPRDLA